jgi:hypothetical protein
MTIAQQLNVKEFPFEIKDERGNTIYSEHSKGDWEKREYDANGNNIYYETSDGYWRKSEFDAKGKGIYFENSNGAVKDKRPKQVELTMDEIAQKLGIDVNQLKIKK